MKFYITFGQAHAHVFNGKTLDKDTVVEIEADDKGDANAWAVATFGAKYSVVYPDLPDMRFFPKGIVKGT